MVQRKKLTSLLIPSYKKYFWGYFLGFLLLVGINSLGAYIPQLIKTTINTLQSAGGFLQSELNTNVLWIIAMALAMAIMRTISRQVIFGIGRSVEYDFKKTIFNHLITMPPSFFTQQKTGDLISIITNDVQSFRAFFGFAMLNVANTLIAFSIIIPLMVGLNPKLTMYFFMVIPVILFVVTLVSNKLKHYQEIVQEKLGVISGFIEQNLSGIHIIKAYAQEEAEVKRFSQINNDLLGDYINLVKCRSLIGPTMRVIASLGFILLLYIGGKDIIENNFSLGDFAAYSLYIERLIWPVATLGWLVTVFYRASVSGERISNILAMLPSIKNEADALDKKSFDQSIELKSLGCKITKGSSVGLVGTIGSGKSVLANKMMHLTELEDNEILIDGLDIKKVKLEDLRSIVNLVPQENFLFSTSIKENIAYAKDMSNEEIIELAKLVGIHDEIMKFPDQYETVVGERGITLSGGQRQRMAIARALSLDSEVLILDDALSSVDNKTATKILQGIHELRKGKTTIFITHKIHAIKDMDQILVMDKLKVVEQGKHDEIINSPTGVYKSLWEAAAHES